MQSQCNELHVFDGCHFKQVNTSVDDIGLTDTVFGGCHFKQVNTKLNKKAFLLRIKLNNVAVKLSPVEGCFRKE